MATLIAQVAMFRNLGGDASVIGAALAIALVGTLYGCMLQTSSPAPSPKSWPSARTGSVPQGKSCCKAS